MIPQEIFINFITQKRGRDRLGGRAAACHIVQRRGGAGDTLPSHAAQLPRIRLSFLPPRRLRRHQFPRRVTVPPQVLDRSRSSPRRERNL
jgi:hypothetical protein